MKTIMSKDKALCLAKFSRWIKVLTIVSILVSAVSSSLLQNLSPILYYAGQGLGLVVSLLYALVLLRMMFASDHYKNSAYCKLAVLGVSIVIIFLKIESDVSSEWTILLGGFLVTILAAFSTYLEYQGHEEATMSVSAEISERWALLWKLCLYAYIGMIVSCLVIMSVYLLGAILLLICSIAMIVIEIRKWMLLGDTAAAYEAWEPQPSSDNPGTYKYF